MSATDGACGSVEARGILFDREAPCETKLASFVVCKSKLAADRAKLVRVALTERIEWMFTLVRLGKVARRAGYSVSGVTRWKDEDDEN